MFIGGVLSFLRRILPRKANGIQEVFPFLRHIFGPVESALITDPVSKLGIKTISFWNFGIFMAFFVRN